MSPYQRPKLTKFSIFALEKETAQPMSRIPFYAEVGIRSLLEPPPIPLDVRFGESTIGALTATDNECLDDGPCQDRVSEILRASISRLLSDTARNELAANNDLATDFLIEVLRRAKDSRNGMTLLGLEVDVLVPILDNALKAEAEARGIVLATPPALQPIAWAHPMGVLATDHVGYLSFDLTRLPDDVYLELQKAVAARRLDPQATLDTTIWVYPMAQEKQRFDALAQGRFAHDAILLKLQLDVFKLPETMKNFGYLSMESPDLTDWRLSPASFATNPGALVGADGCETILPANNALHEFNFHQVIGIPAADVNLPMDPAAAGKVRPGFVNEYRLSFIPIGHSLGQILYSFPLAPGESVNFAVIDWTRRDSALRTETTKVDESLVHELRRDRIISETVRASIDEWQRGGSIMGGLAGSAGGAMGGGGTGLAAGASAAIGGAYSTSSGSRDIAADTVQKLSDNVAQAATSSRELHSTVVVQSSQAEHEAIETRTVVNYNHSHTLTIVYYEVVRHFRVVTEFVRRRPALLTNIHGGIAYVVTDPPGTAPRHEIWWPTIYENRKLLEAALLDERYKEGFDIVERQRHRKRIAEVLGPPPSPQPPTPQGPHFRYFLFEMRTGGLVPEGDEDVQITARIDLNIEPWFIVLGNGDNINPPGAFYQKDHTYSFVARTELNAPRTIPWGQIEVIAIHVHLDQWDSDSQMSFSAIKITGIDVDGQETILVDKSYDPSSHLIFDNDMWLRMPTHRPAPIPLPTRSGESIEEEAKYLEFNEHLLNRRPHYERALRLGTSPAIRAFELASLGVGSGASLLEKVDNRPLEVLGDFVAYPCVDPKWSQAIMAAIEALPAPEMPEDTPIERLITLPTRGVFAEAKLGHCSASEEIDNTRFWDWQQSPIPHMAPEIAAVQAITPQPIVPTGLEPTQFPQSLVNIVNPPNAPDPQGMTAALTALATANIFRDMSGRAEVADLLKKLSDNSVAIAGVAQKSTTGGVGTVSSGSGNAGSGTSGSGGGGVAAVASPPPTAQQTHDKNQVIRGSSELTPEEKKEAIKENTKQMVKPTPPPAPPAPVNKKYSLSFTFTEAHIGTTMSGSFTIVIVDPKAPEEKRSRSFTQHTSNSTIVLQDVELFGSGNISISGYEDVNFENLDFDLGSQPKKRAVLLSGGPKDYVLPKKSDLVRFTVTPFVDKRGTKATNKKEAVDKVSGELGGTIGIKVVDIVGKVAGEQTSTTGTQVETSYTVHFLTGGLSIEQLPGD